MYYTRRFEWPTALDNPPARSYRGLEDPPGPCGIIPPIRLQYHISYQKIAHNCLKFYVTNLFTIMNKNCTNVLNEVFVQV